LKILATFIYYFSLDCFKNSVISIIKNWIKCLGTKISENYEAIILQRASFLNQHLLELKGEIEDIDDAKIILEEIEIVKEECVKIDLEIPIIEVLKIFIYFLLLFKYINYLRTTVK
jgi:hypothetical protein